MRRGDYRIRLQGEGWNRKGSEFGGGLGELMDMCLWTVKQHFVYFMLGLQDSSYHCIGQPLTSN